MDPFWTPTESVMRGYFKDGEWETFSDYQKKNYINMVENYNVMKDLDLNPEMPDFMKKPEMEKAETKRNKIPPDLPKESCKKAKKRRAPTFVPPTVSTKKVEESSGTNSNRVQPKDNKAEDRSKGTKQNETGPLVFQSSNAQSEGNRTENRNNVINQDKTPSDIQNHKAKLKVNEAKETRNKRINQDGTISDVQYNKVQSKENIVENSSENINQTETKPSNILHCRGTSIPSRKISDTKKQQILNDKSNQLSATIKGSPRETSIPSCEISDKKITGAKPEIVNDKSDPLSTTAKGSTRKQGSKFLLDKSENIGKAEKPAVEEKTCHCKTENLFTEKEIAESVMRCNVSQIMIESYVRKLMIKEESRYIVINTLYPETLERMGIVVSEEDKIKSQKFLKNEPVLDEDAQSISANLDENVADIKFLDGLDEDSASFLEGLEDILQSRDFVWDEILHKMEGDVSEDSYTDSETEMEEKSDDDMEPFLYCDTCKVQWNEVCSFGHQLLHLDSWLEQTEQEEELIGCLKLPLGLKIGHSDIPQATVGIRSTSVIEIGVIWGPYIDKTPLNIARHLSGQESMVKKLNFEKPELENQGNWMKLVNYARSEKETNVISFKYRRKIYYKSVKRIKKNEELKVSYQLENTLLKESILRKCIDGHQVQDI